MIRLLTGDCRDMLATLPDASVQCVVTSPPYYGLRDYGTAQWDGGDAGCDHAFVPDAGSTSQRVGREYQQGHPHRNCKCGARRIDRQLGLEATPDEYLQTMVQVFRELRRVLRDDGTVWCNMGDGHKDKQLLMMPARLALALQADGWWLRSDIIWAKPNPMPESVTDRPTNAHEHVFLLTKAARYFYDADAVREDETSRPQNWTTRVYGKAGGDHRNERPERFQPMQRDEVGASGRNLRNVWTIATAPFPAAHFATFAPVLAERCIRAGTSERGCCAQCGKPWVRQTSVSYTDAGNGNNNMARKGGDPAAAMSARPYEVRKLKDVETTGWTAPCQCNADTVPCTVLDPFSGAGTALLVADRLGRDAVGIDLSHAYVEMARARLQADCPLFADITDAPVPEPPEDERMADLFAEAAE